MARGGWSSLPADLLREISGRLSSEADHLYIHQVCTHWRAHTPALAAFRPWVVAGDARRRRLLPIGDYSLRLPLGGAQRVEVGAPPAGLSKCCGASRGWLTLVDDERSPTRFVLWEPLSSTQIPLPCLSSVTRVFLSDDPLASPNWVAVAAQRKGLTGQTMRFWRPGDAAWTAAYELGMFEIESITFNEGKAYCIDMEWGIMICDFSTGPDLHLECTRIQNVCSVVNSICRCDRLHLVRGVHLVACNGELLVVLLRSGSHPSPAEVYKPEWTPNHSMELRERVMDLGEYSLFVGQGDTFALPAKEFPMIKSNCVYYADRHMDKQYWISVFQSNCVYYADRPEEKQYWISPQEKQYWISVFHLESGVLERIPYPEDLKEDATNWTPRSWFCPRTPLVM